MSFFRTVCKSLSRCRTLKASCTVTPSRLCHARPAVDVTDTAVIEYFDQINKEYWDLKTKNTINRFENNRLKELLPIVKVLEERSCVVDNLKNLQELSDEDSKDPDMLQLMKEERNTYTNLLNNLNDKLLDSLFPSDVRFGWSDTILEITQGVGGQEAMLFAREVFELYLEFAKLKAWDCEISQLDSTDIGGIRKAVLHFSGEGTFEILRWEGGVHRVQRVPATEKGGRLHTSTISVAVLLQPTEVELIINDRDLRIETKRSTGAGGQHVNTTDSAVRIVYLPTGLSVECQTERDQHKNRKSAMARLRALLFQQQQEKKDKEERAQRKSQVGAGLRNEKIRTYNYNQDRITDHRLSNGGTVFDLKSYMQGQGLQSLNMRLYNANLLREVLQQIEEIRNAKKSE